MNKDAPCGAKLEEQPCAYSFNTPVRSPSSASPRRFQAEPSPNPISTPIGAATNPTEQAEDVVVRGKALSRYRLELEEAREELIDVYNEENSGDDNDVVCRDERPTGSRMPQRVCRSKAETEAESAAARAFLNGLVIGTGQPEGGAINATVAAVGGAADVVSRTAQSRAEIERNLNA